MGSVKHLGTWLLRHFVFLLFAAYVLAALTPSPGLWLKSLNWGSLPGQGGAITTSLLMLGILLFNAGYSVNTEHLNALRRRPSLSLAGVIGKGFIAIVWVSILMLGLSMGLSTIWISMLAGFAIVSMMPVATSSTAWAQQTNSNMALSLGLLLLSTGLIPFIFPFMSWMLHQLPANLNPNNLVETKTAFSLPFIVIWIIVPVISGRLFRWLSGEKQQTQITMWMKWVNAVNLLLLNYMHGSSFLPQRLHPFQPAAMISLLLGVLVCCTFAFFVGAWLGKILKVTNSERMALMFGTGMNNNGMALVLASQFLGESGWIGLTIALCTFGQHLVAGAVQILFGKTIPDSVHPTEHSPPLSDTGTHQSALISRNRGEPASALLPKKAESNQSNS